MDTKPLTEKDRAVSEQAAYQETPAKKRKQGSDNRLRWFLQTAGWGILLTLALVPLVQQVIGVSQGTSDFCQDYLASARALHGLAPYLPLRCWSALIKIPAPVEYDAHPPFSILFFLPLALLPKVAATTIWGFCCLATYVLSGALLLRVLGWLSLRSAALFALGSVLWPPAILAEDLQNLAQLLTLLLIIAWLLERKKHGGWAGWLIGIAGLLKVWPAFLLLGALAQRRWRFACTGGFALAGGSLLTLVVLGPGAYAAYLGPVQAAEQYWVPNQGNISLVGAVARPLAGDPITPLPPLVSGFSLREAIWVGEVAAGLVLVGALILVWWCHRSCRSSSCDAVELLCQGLLVTVLLLVFPLTWQWGLITLLLPCTTLILALRQVSRPPRWWFGVLVVSLLVLSLQYAWLLALAGRPFAQPLNELAKLRTLLLGLPTLGVLLFAGAQAHLLWRSVPSHRLEVDKRAS